MYLASILIYYCYFLLLDRIAGHVAPLTLYHLFTNNTYEYMIIWLCDALIEQSNSLTRSLHVCTLIITIQLFKKNKQLNKYSYFWYFTSIVLLILEFIKHLPMRLNKLLWDISEFIIELYLGLARFNQIQLIHIKTKSRQLFNMDLVVCVNECSQQTHTRAHPRLHPQTGLWRVENGHFRETYSKR